MRSGFSGNHSADVLIVGAGVAGLVAAAQLAQQGRRVALVDARANCPPVFKAEKVERDEIETLRSLGLFDSLLPHAGRISEVYAAYDGRIFKRLRLEQVGISYPDLVNALRNALSGSVAMRTGRVEQIEHNADGVHARLADGVTLSARLVVLACGITPQLLTQLGLERRVLQKEPCTVLGFDVLPAGLRPFPFQSLTYYPSDAASRVDYLTLFRIRQKMRANLFLFRGGDDASVREFHHQPRLLLERMLPKLTNVIGEYRVSGKVVSGLVNLYQTIGKPPDGAVMIGDAFQNVCPSTGLGLRKVFNDARVLTEHVADWFSTPGMSAEKLASFYRDRRKTGMDAFALQCAIDHRRAATSGSPRWRVYRSLLHMKWNLARPWALPDCSTPAYRRA